MAALSVSRYAIVDSHVHYPDPSYLKPYVDILDTLGITRFNVVCLPHFTRLSVVPDALHLKAHHPQRIYVNGSMDYSVYLTDPDRLGVLDAAYIDTLLAMGCDGIKMWESKPNIRKLYSIPPFDSAVWAPYWEKVAALQVPVLFHLNDPAELWDPVKVPSWAVEHGWFYGDGTYANNETQYAEILAVLKRHPNLKVIFAHFMFFSAELPRLAGYLDRFPNMYVDLAPGVEMYRSFSAAPDATREFFVKYQDRILYGTDYGAAAALAPQRIEIHEDDTRNLLGLVQGFLEADGEYGPLLNRDGSSYFDFVLRGIALPSNALAKIYRGNFDRIYGHRPRVLNPGAIAEECERLIHRIKTPAAMLPGMQGDASVIHEVREYFAGL
ncbi:MAG: amidohydrolase family protein [Anaerolineae bacterium]